MKKHKLDNLFSEKLGDYQNQPSPEAWEKLAESLAQQANKPNWTWIGIAASAVLAAVSSWYMLTTDDSMNSYDYAYAENSTTEVDVPREIVLVPVFIQVPIVGAAAEVQFASQVAETAKNYATDKTISNNMAQAPIVLADNNVLEAELLPVIKEPLPLEEEDEALIIASVKETAVEDQSNTHESLTIIYKQGEPEPESNITKAINYMEDVRKGDKKLVDFKKIGNSIKAKFKSSKDVNSK